MKYQYALTKLLYLLAVLTLLLSLVILILPDLAQASYVPLVHSITTKPGLTGNFQTTNHCYVDAINGSDITGDGTSNAPWQTITYALAQVTGPNAEIHVTAGTYNTALGESFPLTMKPGVSLIGAGYPTTKIYGNSSKSVIHFPGTATFTQTTVISGFTIIGGLEGIRVDGSGGTGSSPTIQANWITENTFGIYNWAFRVNQVYTIISGNLISDNDFGIFNNAQYNAHTESIIKNNQIVRNGSDGIYCYAGDDYGSISSCSPTIIGNFIADNEGDGVDCTSFQTGDCSPQLIHNTITNNHRGVRRAHSGSYWVTSKPKLINNLIFNNPQGGVFFVTSSSGGSDQPTLVNNTIAYNNGYGVRDGLPTIVNSIIWGNGDDLNTDPSHVSFSNVGDSGYEGINNNISASPQFADPAHSDYHLLHTSPLLDAGDSLHPDVPATDIDGDVRPLGAAIDIGADETSPYSISISKSVQSLHPAYLGDVLTYTITLTNLGSVSAGGPLITDTLPVNTQWTGYLQADGGYASISNGVLTWLSTLPANRSQNLTYSLMVSRTSPLGAFITNTAIVADRTGGITETAPVVVPLGATVLLNSSRQEVTDNYAQPNQTLSYTVTLSNLGNVSANDVIVTDTLDNNVSLAMASAGGIFSNNRVIWSGLTIAPDTTITLTLVVTVNTPLSDATSVVNQVRVTASNHPAFDLSTSEATTLIYSPVQVDFSASPTLGPAPLAVSFNNSSLHGVNYVWSYGDGSSSTTTASTHSHSYSNPGVYTLTLQASNPLGSDVGTRAQYITVYQQPSASFSGSPSVGLVPLTVTFTNSSLYANQYLWHYGDGQTAATAATTHTHTYTSTGVFTVSLIASNSYTSHTYTRTNYIGVYNPSVANFSATPITGTAPLSVFFSNTSQDANYFRWDFGDGNFSSVISPTHVYQTSGVYTVTLRAGNPATTDQLSRAHYITVYGPPQPNFVGTPLTGLGSLTTTFTNNSQSAESYFWNYGDGQTSTTSSITHTHFYAAPGAYTVTLAAMNTYGVLTKTKVAYVNVYTMPVPAFTATPLTGTGPLTVTFTNNSTGATGYLWSFGDETTSKATQPTHTYNSTGHYTVTLTASNPVTSVTLTRANYIEVYDFHVISTNPSGNRVSVAPSTPISVTFNRPINPGTVTSQTFTVRGLATGTYPGTYIRSSNSVQFVPDYPFKPGEKIMVNLSNGLMSLDGLPLVPYAWEFRADVNSGNGKGSGIFIGNGQSLGSEQSMAVALGDLDGDADLDAFVGNGGAVGQADQIWLNDGVGRFNDTGQKIGDWDTRAVALGDLDGDGDLDAFSSAYYNGSSVWLNDGLGHFNSSGQSLDSISVYSHDIALGDLDSDGDLDAFVASEVSNKIWLNDGFGYFRSNGQSFEKWYSLAVDLGDLDGDGDLDAFTITYSSKGDKVWLNDGLGNFSDSGQSLGHVESWDVALGDLDGDGDLDAFVGVSGIDNANQIWLNNGLGTFSDSDQRLGHSSTYGVALGDLDGDGDLDAFVANSHDQASEIWLNNGTGKFSFSGQNLGNSDSYDVALGDLDTDGDLDAFVANYNFPNGQANEVWLDKASVLPSQLIPVSGGTITPTDGVTLTASSGVFSDTVLITYTPKPTTSTGSLSSVDLFYELEASYVSNGSPAHPQSGRSYTITVTYQQEDVPVGVNEADLALYYWDGAAWIKEPTSVVNVTAHTITATPHHFSLWAALVASSESPQSIFLPIILK